MITFVGLKFYFLDLGNLYWAIAIALVIGAAAAYLLWKQQDMKKNTTKVPEKSGQDSISLQLQLQAYERLILLSDRIALPNVISRSNQSGVSLRDMQHLLVNTIKQEFDHNITQQIYVSPEAWEAVRNLREQNIHIINQVASFLPESASGNDLNRQILEMIVQNPKVSLHNIVSEVLSFEAKKLLNRA